MSYLLMNCLKPRKNALVLLSAIIELKFAFRFLQFVKRSKSRKQVFHLNFLTRSILKQQIAIYPARLHITVYLIFSIVLKVCYGVSLDCL